MLQLAEVPLKHSTWRTALSVGGLPAAPLLPPLLGCSCLEQFSSNHQQSGCRHLSTALTFCLQLAEASLQEEVGEAVQTAASVGNTARDDLQQWALRLPVGVRRLLAGGLAG